MESIGVKGECVIEQQQPIEKSNNQFLLDIKNEL